MRCENLTIPRLLRHYRDGDFTPRQLVMHLLEQANKLSSYDTWIYLMTIDEIQHYLDVLDKCSVDNLPLYGIPFAIKDNIDLQGIPTTAACEAFRYVPTQSATVVQTLIDAGAIPLGKTNLDQFATGLVGVRSPYGETKNAFDEQFISGGSSSGSAIAVAQGLVSFSLGTDTAGSGRVPAAFNNILGLKPSRGLLSNSGVVPACRSLDCVALFATTSGDLQTLFEVTCAFDENDCYSRELPKTYNDVKSANQPFRFAVPKSNQLAFFGNVEYQRLFYQAVTCLESLGGLREEVDFSPFIDAAKLLYEGPWVTERYLACQPLIDSQPDAMLDVTRGIIEPGKHPKATEVFSAQYKLQCCKQRADAQMTGVDFLLTPTAGTIYTREAIADDPVRLNANLGYYTNFMNLLDYSAVAVPAGFTNTGLPFGVTLVSRVFQDRQLLEYARMLQQSQGLPLGSTGWPLPTEQQYPANLHKTMTIAVCGAHMSGLPLNHQLLERDAVRVMQCRSAPAYKLLALPGGPPQRPGMVRVTGDAQGSAIEMEVWQMPAEHFGSFLAGIPHPLGLGKVELEDGSWVTGFICEGYISSSARDISEYGGWRAYCDSQS